ncbi:MAG TPA: hypothetical protein VFG14_12115 [Chthoniobacteraceae bacterium]|nr:hypothetical protein [Chthoniobacteraceae bacterium]
MKGRIGSLMSIDQAEQLAFSIFCTVDFLPEDIRRLEWTRFKISGELAMLSKQKMIEDTSALHEQSEYWIHTINDYLAGRTTISDRFKADIWHE